MISKPSREPVQVRSYDLVERLLKAAKQDNTPEGRYAINRLKTRAKQAEARAPKVAKRRAERKRKGGESFSDLMHKADRVFSLFIRWRDTVDTVNGRWGTCATCKHAQGWATLQCGHWIRRENWGTRWDDRNCHIQDTLCNYHRGGEEEKHAAWIEYFHGHGTCDRLRVLAKVNKRKPSDAAVREVIKDYAGRLRLMGYPGDLSDFMPEATPIHVPNGKDLRP